MGKIIRAMTAVAGVLGGMAAFVFPLRVKNGLSLFYSLVYSAYHRRFFARCGSGFFIRNPIYLIGPRYISIGANFYAGYRLRLEAHGRGGGTPPTIVIGDNVSFNYDCHVGCSNRVIIGNNVLFASKIFVTDHYHGDIDAQALLVAPACRPVYSKGPVVIEDNVWIGEGVAIMPNVTIGRNCIIGANSVVTTSVPANSVVAGIPAKVLRILDSASVAG